MRDNLDNTHDVTTIEESCKDTSRSVLNNFRYYMYAWFTHMSFGWFWNKEVVYSVKIIQCPNFLIFWLFKKKKFFKFLIVSLLYVCMIHVHVIWLILKLRSCIFSKNYSVSKFFNFLIFFLKNFFFKFLIVSLLNYMYVSNRALAWFSCLLFMSRCRECFRIK